MSVKLSRPMNQDQMQAMSELLEPVFADESNMLFDRLEVNSQGFRKAANELGQVIEVELNDIEDIKTMADGSRYRVTDSGWEKLV